MPRKIVIRAFLITTAIALVELLISIAWNTQPSKTLRVLIWGAFYISCLLITIYGTVKGAALEGTVYCVTIFGEAFAPGLCEKLLSRVPELDGAHIDISQSHALTTVTAHLTLTLAACTIVLGWAIVLIFKQMGRGQTPVWVRAYIMFTMVAAISVIIWGIYDPAGFVGLPAAKNGTYINGLWPSMVDSWLSYARIVLAFATLFLPWVKNAIDNTEPQSSGGSS